mgnify:CR=1 FL=1
MRVAQQYTGILARDYWSTPDSDERANQLPVAPFTPGNRIVLIRSIFRLKDCYYSGQI